MLKLSAYDYEQLRRHGEATYPDECCGVLVGEAQGEIRTVRYGVRCNNACVESPQNRYDIDPRELIPVQREARERQLEVIGFYHSHPDHPPLWSTTDLEQAHWIGCSYVITAISKGRAAETRSYVLAGTLEEDKRFVDEALIVGDPGRLRLEKVGR